MTEQPLDEWYFEWLYDQIKPQGGMRTNLRYAIVTGEMNRIIFDPSIPNDDNRQADGHELRLEFIETHGLTMHPMNDFLDEPVTLFEVLVGLARRCDFQVELGVSNWFFTFMQNLNIAKYADNDAASNVRSKITRALNKLNNRTYTQNGAGGLFPLKHANKDQRTVELWYQMQAYIIENDLLGIN